MNNKKVESSDEEIVVNEIMNERYSESEGLIGLMKDFPGSTYAELLRLSGMRESDFNRAMVWLEGEEMVYQEDEYYYADEDSL